MKTYNNLWEHLCSYENLGLAFQKARKNKTQKLYVTEFEDNLQENLSALRTELLLYTYSPKPLKTFVLHDPKTRKISKSEFRDRVIHHAICNVLGPIFDRSFIYDSYANRKGKGTLKAVKRFDVFKRKISRNCTQKAFILKADIKHYFDEVDCSLLIEIIRKRIKDEKVIWLIKKIFSNYQTKKEGKGMPLGNLTSQFFANVYLNELDQFVKNELKIKYYIRYVDDFVILSKDKKYLEETKDKIHAFIKQNLLLELHPDKCKILLLKDGIPFLGFRIFQHHKLLKKSNLRKMKRTLEEYKALYDAGLIDYDKVYDCFQGWFAYIKNANTYKLQKNIKQKLQEYFPNEFSTCELNKLVKESKRDIFALHYSYYKKSNLIFL